MANFKTHVTVAFVGSAAVALCAMSVGVVNWIEAPWLILLGTIGGLLPDIDSDNTKQVKVLFISLSIASFFMVLTKGGTVQDLSALFASGTLFCQAASFDLSVIIKNLSSQCVSYTLILMAIIAYFGVRYPLFALFKSLTVHRGVFHSILAAVFFALLTTCIVYYGLKQNAMLAWLSGEFVCTGFIIHLLLDEAYSVDLSNVRLKRSFGTALKLYGYRSLLASFAMLVCTLFLYSIAPSSTSFVVALQKAVNTVENDSSVGI